MKSLKKSRKSSAVEAVRVSHYDVIRAPIITEKSTAATEQNKVYFQVALSASKPAIKAAVEALFQVKVERVNTLIRLGKTKGFRGTIGKQSDVKKAVVTLAAGQSIDLSAGAR
jgi:large subunit ribosomal protein L23